MASDSVTDEFRTHQSRKKNHNQYGSGIFVPSMGLTFQLHLTHHDWLLLSRLLAIGNQMSKTANAMLAHEWQELSGQMGSVLSHAEIKCENEGQETSYR